MIASLHPCWSSPLLGFEYTYFRFEKKKEEINTFIQHRRIKLIKSDSEDIHNVTKDLYFS